MGIKRKALKYTLLDGDLYKRTTDGLLVKYVSKVESLRIMGEVHEGIYGSHKLGTKMRWLIHRYGYFLPGISVDHVKYAKGCEECEWRGPLQRVSAKELHSIVNPWPFRGWARDLICKIHPSSSE